MESIKLSDRFILIGGIGVLVILSWLYLIDMALDMAAMPMADMSMNGMPMNGMSMNMPWTALDILLLFVMWAVMMVAIMLPTATPMIMTFASVNQRRHLNNRPVIPTGIFVAGYIFSWSAYSLIATLLQWFLHERALLSPDMVINSSYLSGGILIAAGIFQFTPQKYACLQHCRSPLSFLMSDWREGYRGAFIMGLRHGGYCIGCCWVLMLLLFVTGVMNLLAVFLISAFVLTEKLVSRGQLLARISGLVFCIAGLGIILA